MRPRSDKLEKGDKRLSAGGTGVSESAPEAGERPEETVVVSGPLTLAEAPRWREALQSAISGGNAVRIDLEAAGPWDLAGLQLMLSALASGKRSGQAVRLVNVPDVFLTIVDQAGLSERLKEAIASRAV